jgi:hypothetical protein
MELWLNYRLGFGAPQRRRFSSLFFLFVSLVFCACDFAFVTVRPLSFGGACDSSSETYFILFF